MSNPDILFKGIPRAPTRAYTARVIRALRPSLVVIPCAGSFSLAAVAVQSGVLPHQIVCGDISLYSSALGALVSDYLLTVTPKNDLGQQLATFLADPLTRVAAIFWALRYLQYQKQNPNHFVLSMQRELLENRMAYLKQLSTQLESFKTQLNGIHYQARDMWDTLADHRNDPHALLLTNPPRYTGGYDRMFKGIDDVFEWPAPPASQFTESDYARLMELLGHSKATTLMYYATQGEDPSPLWGDPWRSVFADKPGNKRVAAFNWIIANRPLDIIASRTRLTDTRSPFPLFSGTVSDKSVLHAAEIPRDVAEHYRDLFIHKLPGPMLERTAALFLDGFLFAVIGLNPNQYNGSSGKQRASQLTKGRPMYITFAFSVPHPVYVRLHKLTLMCLRASWFWQTTLARHNLFSVLGVPSVVRTTMLTYHPENKTARGVLKLLSREQQPDGTYKLLYEGTVIQQLPQDTLNEWMLKWIPKS